MQPAGRPFFWFSVVARSRLGDGTGSYPVVECV